MNKTITVNISGLVFYIEEPGFELLKSYLDRLKTLFGHTAGGYDIIADIEARIAELFKARLSSDQQVIHEADVREVIETLGRPEDFADEAEAADYTEATNQVPTGKQPKRMFRDTENEYVAGVAAGLSHYFGWDVVIFRLAFVLLAVFGGSGIPIYIILWIVLPEAKTTADKLNMRGEPVTLDNIKRKVEEEMRTAEERINKGAKRAERAFKSQNFRQGVESAGSVLGKVLHIIVGIWLLLIGIGLIVGPLIGYMVGDIMMGSNGSPIEMSAYVFPDATSWWLIFLGGLIVWIIPATVLMYLGMRLLGVSAKPHASVGWLLTGLFLAGVISVIFGGVRTGKEFSRSGEIMSKHTIEQPAADTLHVRFLPDDQFKYPTHSNLDTEYFDLFKVENDSFYVAEPIHLGFEELPAGSAPTFTLVRSSQGSDYDDAYTKAENISYAYQVDSTGIWLGSHIRFPQEHKIRGQYVDLTIGIPLGQVICFDQHIHRVYGSRMVREGCFTRQNEEWAEVR